LSTGYPASKRASTQRLVLQMLHDVTRNCTLLTTDAVTCDPQTYCRCFNTCIRAPV